MRDYASLLPYAFRRFSILSAVRTLGPAIRYYATREPLPAGGKPALFTMNILPPMMTVWHHCAKKYLGDGVDITIFDCSGTLDPADCPGSRVQKFLNLYAAAKCQEFLEHIAARRRIAWLCDDDVFFTGSSALPALEREFAQPGTASVSFRPRPWWQFDIDGKKVQPSGSYCVAVDRTIFVEREHLSLAPAGGNPHPPEGNHRAPRRYDTFDKANEILLRKGYRCAIVPEREREQCLAVFSGLSGAVMLLSYFRTPGQVLDYYLTPPKRQWGGNMLYGTLCSLLAISTIQECYARLKGKPYPLPSLPSRPALEKIRRDHRQYLREGHSFDWVDAASEKLKKAL